MMRRPGMLARASWVALTPPSTEFSIAIIAATLRPLDDVGEGLAHVVDGAPGLARGLGHLGERRLGEGPGRPQVAVGAHRESLAWLTA